ncbi:MAG: hypothetical protein K0R39_3960 [Symbiobacteriaceae bacterium]|jgi:hypothetical protein|nr:hypothetical protein [Symbiobacteriaceae bacterium]
MNPSISNRMRNRIQEILVADGVADVTALTEANSLVDGLGYYHRVTTTTGLKINRAYSALEVRGPEGDLIEEIPFDREDDDAFY